MSLNQADSTPGDRPMASAAAAMVICSRLADTVAYNSAECVWLCRATQNDVFLPVVSTENC